MVDLLRSAHADGPVANLPNTGNPVYSMVDTKNKYLYVLNQSNGNTNVANTNSYYGSVGTTMNFPLILNSPTNIINAGTDVEIHAGARLDLQCSQSIIALIFPASSTITFFKRRSP